MRLILLGLVCLSVHAETLGAVLRERGIAAAGFTDEEMRRAVTSYAVSTGGSPLLLAYYVDDNSGTVGWPLHVIRKEGGVVHRGTLRDVTTRWMNPESACLGSAISIQPAGERTVIFTHRNPSAGCTLILNRELDVEFTYPGWPKSFVTPRHLLVQQSMVHFAPVHAMKLEVIDLEHRRAEPVYPMPSDQLHAGYSRLLAKHMPPRDWCMRANSPCDATEFDSYVDGEIVVNEAADVFGFRAVLYSPYGDDETGRAPQAEAVYVYRLRGSRWEGAAAWAGDLEKEPGGADLRRLVLREPDTLFSRRR